jgi:hypothetical protein
MEMPKNQKDRAEWYNRVAEVPQNDATKINITSKAKGQLADGYSKLETPAFKAGYDPDERDDVGARWPGPKGRVGKVLHGKSSPASKADCVYVAPNRELKAK